MYGEGISREGDLLDVAANNGIVEKSGSWYSYEGERLGQGRENCKLYLKENKEIARKIWRQVLESFDLGNAPVKADSTAKSPPSQKKKSVSKKK